MRMHRSAYALLLAALAFLMLSACTVTQTVPQEELIASSKPAPVSYSPYDGPRIPAAVLPFGLPEQVARRYPHLLEKSVGLGIYNLLTQELYRTGRFRLVERDPKVMEAVLKEHELAFSGLVDPGTAARIGRFLGARVVVYGEVYDYSEGIVEKTTGFKTVQTPRVRVGVQMRVVDVETLELIPASGIAYGVDYGGASHSAIRQATAAFVSHEMLGG
jgi:curli biogenesis system outer membrane secretion channel CsgG